MTETQVEPQPLPDSGTFLGNLFNLYFEPAATFAKIFAKPRLLMVILLQTAIGVGFTTIWLQKVDTREFMRQQMEQNARLQQMPAEDVERIINSQANVMKTWGRIGPVIAPVLVDLVLAGIFLFVFRFFMAADVSFRQSLATVTWSLVALGLIQTPIMLAVFWLKGDWNVDPNQVIQANPTLFFEPGDLPSWLSSLLASLDLFSLWTAFLFATGFSVAAKKGLSTGVWGVGVLWVIYVMLKIGFRLLVG